jgi:hypothetical protein
MENIQVMQVKVMIKLNEIQEIRKNLKDPKIEDDVLVIERSSNFDYDLFKTLFQKNKNGFCQN